MAEHQVLFCPFCRESFERLSTCPEHDLALVPFHRLAEDPSESQEVARFDEDTPCSAFDPRFGRGYVAAGALINGCALLPDLVLLSGGKGLSTLLVATALPALWSLGLVSFTLFFVLQRRRTLRALRAMRVLVPVLAGVSPATVLWELHRLRGGAAHWLTRGRAIELGPALYLVLAAALLIAFGGARLGRRRV